MPVDHAAARWVRGTPRSRAADDVARVASAALGARVVACEPLPGGYRNSNSKLRLDDGSSVVFRAYEHDPSLCRKELDLLKLISGTVPVPEVLYAACHGRDSFGPFIVTRYVEGLSLHALKASGDREAIAQVARSAGETLAAIGRYLFPKAGWIAPGLTVTDPLMEGDDAGPRFVDQCLASPHLAARVRAELRERVHRAMWEGAPGLAALDGERRLVHCDFNKRNLLVHSEAGSWRVAAVLDWEFAVSGSPLADFGNFLRYERAGDPLLEPHFSRAYLAAGGELPPDWRRLMRLIDLTALCASLTREELPDDVAAEIVGLVAATVEGRDPPN